MEASGDRHRKQPARFYVKVDMTVVDINSLCQCRAARLFITVVICDLRPLQISRYQASTIVRHSRPSVRPVSPYQGNVWPFPGSLVILGHGHCALNIGRLVRESVSKNSWYSSSRRGPLNWHGALSQAVCCGLVTLVGRITKDTLVFRVHHCRRQAVLINLWDSGGVNTQLYHLKALS